MNAQATKHYTNRSNTLRALKSQYGNDVASRAGELIGKDNNGFYIRAELLNTSAPANAAPWETQQTTPASAPAAKSLVASLLAQVAREKLAAPVQAAQKRVRIERNGVARPQSDKIIGKIWDLLDELAKTHCNVTASMVKKHPTAIENNWNPTTIGCQTVSWRKFNKEV